MLHCHWLSTPGTNLQVIPSIKQSPQTYQTKSASTLKTLCDENLKANEYLESVMKDAAQMPCEVKK